MIRNRVRHLCIIAFVCMLPAHAQAPAVSAPPRPEFEVASIKPNDVGGRNVRIGVSPGGRFNAENVWVRLLIRFAYDVKEFRIAGAPDWTASERFDATAKAENNVNPDQMRPMLQALLADRFGLKLHRETKELPVYLLTAAKGGFKLRESKEGTYITPGPDMPPPAPGQKPPRFCGNMMLRRNGFDGFAIGIDRLVATLSDVAGRTVVDKTGLIGKFDVHLEWAVDEATPGMVAPGLPPGTGKPPDGTDSGPSIFTALQEQPGLKLKSSKSPIEVLVIDHVERPSEN